MVSITAGLKQLSIFNTPWKWRRNLARTSSGFVSELPCSSRIPVDVTCSDRHPWHNDCKCLTHCHCDIPWCSFSSVCRQTSSMHSSLARLTTHATSLWAARKCEREELVSFCSISLCSLFLVSMTGVMVAAADLNQSG